MSKRIKTKQGLLRGGMSEFLAQLSAAAQVQWDELLESGRSESEAQKTLGSSEDHSICMDLTDLHVDSAGEIYLLAGYPHPDADYGYTPWDESYVGSENWNQPWTDDSWIEQIHDDELCERAREGQTYSEVDYTHVLHFDGGQWMLENLPLPGETFFDLGDDFGLAITSDHGGLILRQDETWVSWQFEERMPAVLDLALIDGQVMGRTSNGRAGRIQKNGTSLSWEDQQFMGKPAVKSDLVLGPGERLWQLESNALSFTDDGHWWDPVRFR